MKTVSGSIVSSKPISLSKAASILNTFVSAETGASNAISAFLRRASNSFNELVEFHNEAKGKRSKKKLKARISFGSLSLGNGNFADDGVGAATSAAAADLKEEEQSVRYSEVVSEGVGRGDLYEEKGSGEMKKGKKKKKKKRDEIEGEEEEEEKKSSERKKRKNKVKVEDGWVVDSEEKHERKKKKRRNYLY